MSVTSFVGRIPFGVKIFAGFALIIIVAFALVYYITNDIFFEQFREFSQEGRLQHARTILPFLSRALSGRGFGGPNGGRPPDQGQRQGLPLEQIQALQDLEYDRLPRELAQIYGPLRFLVVTDTEGTIIIAADDEIRGQAIDADQYTFISPIPDGRRIVGALYASAELYEPTQAELDFLNYINSVILVSGFIAAVLGLLLAFWLIRQFTSPLQELATASLRISEGEYEQSVNINSQDAIGQLGAAFNTMSSKIARSETLRRNMIADIAHELRTPLTLIQGNLQAILDGIYEPSNEKIESIHEKSLLLSRLIKDLQELSLAEAGELPLNLHDTNLVTLVESTAAALRPHLSHKSISLKVDTPDMELRASIDSERIGQVLINLLSNAERFTPEAGEISVRAWQDDGSALVSVSDSGPGIPKADLPNVFERFWREDRSRVRTSGGTGLGLAVAKELIESHGGEIWAESEEGNGATFTFSIPLNVNHGLGNGSSSSD